jgi:KDO2-lipid IV(A) lauroyltransferase
MLTYVIFRLAVFLARRLPERWGSAIARGLARLVYRVSPLSSAGRDNARHVLGPDASTDSVSRLARQAVQSRLLNYYDLLRLSAMPLQELSRRVTFEGLEHLERVVVEKRGAVVASGHIGPMEFMIQAVVGLGYPLIGVTEHLKPERLHRFVMGLRSAHGLNLISTQGSLLDVYRRLKRGEVLLSAIDRDSTGTGLFVDVFGAPAWMPDGYARVAVRANVPLLFGFCHRAERGGVVNKIYPPIYPDRSLGKEDAVVDLIQQAVRLFEDAVREYPQEWHLSTPIWQLAQERLEKGAPG